MLTPRQIELIKATVPVLREHGVALTSHFYKRMLSGNPEVKHMFNQAHQAKGHQQKALAAAVLAYAENIEDPTPLLPAVRHIAVKHCTIGVRAEQYGVVGKHLLASIREVLGEAATDELIDAWAAAYGQLADILIGAESDIYKEQAMAEGGWSGWRPFRVTRREDAGSGVVSFYLAPADGGSLPAFQPGQFVSVRAFIKEIGLSQPRQYTLSSSEGGRELRISVKRECPADAPKGAMSNHLHDNLQTGDVIEVSAPLGDFVLREGNSPVVFLSAGIGITPMIAMLGALARKGDSRPVRFIHVARDSQHFPLSAEVENLISRLPNARLQVFYTRPSESDALRCCAVGRPDEEALRKLCIPADADVYLCGPVPFMDAQRKALAACGIPQDRIHYEVFGTGEMAGS
ncbi:MAG: NO-inducible flavohemoprotein [Mailhella sp.]|nr:NO-inducible flavohemoprotein [Mailhella sp.]